MLSIDCIVYTLLSYVEEALDKNLENKCYPLQKQAFNPYQIIVTRAIHSRNTILFNECKCMNVN